MRSEDFILRQQPGISSWWSRRLLQPQTDHIHPQEKQPWWTSRLLRRKNHQPHWNWFYWHFFYGLRHRVHRHVAVTSKKHNRQRSPSKITWRPTKGNWLAQSNNKAWCSMQTCLKLHQQHIPAYVSKNRCATRPITISLKKRITPGRNFIQENALSRAFSNVKLYR